MQGTGKDRLGSKDPIIAREVVRMSIENFPSCSSTFKPDPVPHQNNLAAAGSYYPSLELCVFLLPSFRVDAMEYDGYSNTVKQAKKVRWRMENGEKVEDFLQKNDGALVIVDSTIDQHLNHLSLMLMAVHI